jgi:hypothetical protein
LEQREGRIRKHEKNRENSGENITVVRTGRASGTVGHEYFLLKAKHLSTKKPPRKSSLASLCTGTSPSLCRIQTRGERERGKTAEFMRQVLQDSEEGQKTPEFLVKCNDGARGF